MHSLFGGTEVEMRWWRLQWNVGLCNTVGIHQWPRAGVGSMSLDSVPVPSRCSTLKLLKQTITSQEIIVAMQ